MYDWQDKDGHGKLLKILNKLTENGYNARMANSKMFVILYNEKEERICHAYSSSWHSRGLISVECNYGVTEIGSTFDPYRAYDMMVEYYNRNKEG